MSSRKPLIMGTGHSDTFQTPAYAVQPLVPYLPAGATLWECAAGKGSLTIALRTAGFSVVATDVDGGGWDFLKDELPTPFDAIVTNPPYRWKDQFLTRCYELQRPFALLLPLTALETEKRQALYHEHGLELILMPYRVRYATPSGKKSRPWFATAWFTHGLRIGREITCYRGPRPASLAPESANGAKK